ncbi:MAG: GNAT family N-acetyltransferase [Nanoarchaeota archaeon]|nr:GNAT family N-acetyltransferase [Nanoarchaeota archaeon]
MELELVAPHQRDRVAPLLLAYWKERGLVIDEHWVTTYLKKGHATETTTDEFFCTKQGNTIIGVISLVTDISGVAEIRDEVAPDSETLKAMIAALLGLAQTRNNRKVYSLALPENVPVYESLGFVSEGTLRNHFVEGEDVIVMSRFLNTLKSRNKEKWI